MPTTLHPPSGGGTGPRWRMQELVDRQRARAGRRGARRTCAELHTYVTFIGYPRSGHSMVGSLLDAHPRVAISHELDALHYVAGGYDRWRLFSLILANCRRTQRRGRVQTGYSYAVEGQWQGRWDRLAVIGDKKGGRSTLRFDEQPELLDRLRAVVRLPVRFVLIVRNPFDNVATIARRDVEEQGLDPSTATEHAVRRYLDLTRAVGEFLARVAPSDVHVARHEDFIASPARELRRLCAFVGVDADDAYIDACASLLFEAPSRSRDKTAWAASQRSALDAAIAHHAFLSGYAFDA